MTAYQVVQDMLVALDNDDIETVARCLADDLTFQSASFRVGKADFLRVLSAMSSMQPPVAWLLIDFNTIEDQVHVKLEPAGENTGTLLKPGMKLNSSKDAETTSQLSKWVFDARGTKIRSIAVHAEPGSLLADLLKQLDLH